MRKRDMAALREVSEVLEVAAVCMARVVCESDAPDEARNFAQKQWLRLGKIQVAFEEYIEEAAEKAASTHGSEWLDGAGTSLPACSGGGCFEGCSHSPSGQAWDEGYRAAVTKAAWVCAAMVVGGRAWTTEQAIAADALFAAAKGILALADCASPLEASKEALLKGS